MHLKRFTDRLSESGVGHKTDEPMSLHTTFGVGGNADVFVMPETADEIVAVLKAAREFDVPVLIVGNGSNLLVSDAGIEGAVIRTTGLSDISVEGSTITALCGAKLSALCLAAESNSLTGLEFAYGIPGTVGGALFMNAGAYGGEMKDCVISARYIDDDLTVRTAKAEDLDLGYRTSAFQKNGGTVVSVTVELKNGDKDEIRRKMDEVTAKRISKQPLDKRSAGSTFKRPEGNYAGTLIEKCGLKGKKVGGASVSEKHAGFIVNDGGATCKDILELISIVRNEVFEKTGYLLEPEVRFEGRRHK